MRTFAAILSCLVVFSAAAIEKETVKSTISEVTVYTQGAQVFRKASYTIKPGVTQLVIEGISPNIDPKSLQVKATGSVVLIDSKYSTYYPQPVVVPMGEVPLKIQKQINALRDSISTIDYDIMELADEIAVQQASKNILANNGAIKGTGKVNDSIPLLKDAMEYYQTKMNEINKKILALTRRKTAKQRIVDEMNQRLADLENYQSSNEPEQPKGPIHQIVVTVQAKEAASGKLTVSYLVNSANWIPMYDLRSDITTGKVNLTYKAHVSQNSGEDWDDVRLTISTNNPYQNKTRPVLHPWYIDYYVANTYKTPTPMANAGITGYTNAPTYNNDIQLSAKDLGEDAGSLASYEFTTMIDNVISAEFKIDLPYSIKSNGEQHMVLIKNTDLNATYKYISVPKMELSAYLVAQVVKLDELQLVPATANIFFDGSYMGETYLDPTTMDDTLSLSLGKDPNIIVKRTLLKKDLDEKILDKHKERTYSYEIEIKNLKSNNVSLIIKDQVPVTTNSEITITPTDLSKANYNTTTGILNWEFDLKAHENKKIRFGYKVKHDKDQQVVIN